MAPAVRTTRDSQAPAAAPVSRLSREARREQLLEVAAHLIVELGPAALTMERLGERAGVSKALPYSHFVNADDVLAALYVRETNNMGRRVTEAQSGITDPDERLRAAVHAYFEVVKERGTILAVILGSRPAGAAEMDEYDLVARRFVPDLLEDTFGIRGKTALVLGEVLQGALAGAVAVWARGDVSRAVAERTVCSFVIAGLRESAPGS